MTPARRALTLTDLAVCIVAATLLLTATLAAAQRAREQDARVECATNLRQIGLAMMMYANEQVRTGQFPRTVYDVDKADGPTAYTNWKSPGSFEPAKPEDKKPGQPPAPEPNDVTAAFYLVLKTQDIVPDVFVCPASQTARPLPFKQFAAAAEKAGKRPAEPVADKVTDLSNFPGPQHLSYSYSNPYASKAAIAQGWKFNNTLPGEFPLIADINPGGAAVAKVTVTSGKAEMAKANSPNHGGEGQNVVYTDGHAEFQATPFAGAPLRDANGQETRERDNIYTPQAGADAAEKKGGDPVMGPAMTVTDAVLLPPADLKPAGGGAR